MIYKHFATRNSEDKSDPIFMVKTKHALIVAFYTFIVFIGCFYHLLRNDGGTFELS